ncbi:multiheme c-type cytochrome [Stieleria maiorica]|nr:multiheme c-type cytochrome [Stieleria maiorica]
MDRFGNRSLAMMVAVASGFCLVTLCARCVAVDDKGEVRPSNVAESVASVSAPTYVGKQVCRECHPQNFDLHQHSGHADTFSRSVDSEIAKKYAGKALDAGNPYGVFHYEWGNEGLRTRRAADMDQAPFALQYAVGSGRNAMTLLTLIDDKESDAAGIEHRISWFGSHGDFGLTPGHIGMTPQDERGLLGNVVRGKSVRQCVYCHTTTGTIVGTEIVDLVADVNCEKCHGPGSEHVQQARRSETPPPFSIGRDRWDLEAELQLCGDCHRLPRNIDPVALREYSAELLRFQPVGMLRSECYLESDGNFMCSTCHNPHQDSKAKSTAAYEQDCLGCHQPDSDAHVACSVSPTSGCVECHMPATKFEQGMVFHDHWIRIRDAE